MSSPNNLEINGNLTAHPLAELLVEVAEARLDGSLRLSHHDSKTIIYFRNGETVFAVSNQRRHRIFELLLHSAMLTKQQLVEIPEFTNDLVLAKTLQEKEMFSASALKSIFAAQIEGILREVIGWKEGIWTFSSLARIKEDIYYAVDVPNILAEYARNVPKDTIVRRFKSFNETFGRKPDSSVQINLLPPEAFLLSRFEQSFVKIDEIKSLSGLSDTETLQNLYVLWLAGLIYRENWDAAFKEHQISSIAAAKFEVKKQAALPETKAVTIETKPEIKVETAEETAPAEEKAELTLEQYLAQIENAETHYELLNISHKADSAEIKMAYFGLAKRFHPDLFHRGTDAATHSRVQTAFTGLAHAYEVLRDGETRQTYDYKLRKILAELEKLSPEERSKPVVEQTVLTEASEIFERGFNHLVEEDYEQAMPYIVRALTMSPDTARYHAYYGKLLSMDKNQRFKAEAELQTAIKLEAGNPTFRIMLVEFFIHYNLLKRAEGELNRMLVIFPDNREARVLLDSLRSAS